MCNFLLVLVLRDGTILHHPMIYSHSMLQRYFAKRPELANVLRDHDRLERFARVEFTPGEHWVDPEKWTLKTDEIVRPAWFDETLENQTRKRLVSMVRSMTLLEGEHSVIVDGCWIVGGTAVVREVLGGRIVAVLDSAQIRGVGGSAQIRGVGGSAQIHDVGGSAQIHDVWGKAQIRGVWGSAQIHDVWGKAQIRGVMDSAQIRGVGGSAQIHDVRDRVFLDDTARAAYERAKKACGPSPAGGGA